MRLLKHGTLSRYKKGCRCARCRSANAAWSRAYAARTQIHLRTRRTVCPECGGVMSAGNGAGREPARCAGCHRTRLAELVRCGTNSAYSKGCRCDDCRRAHRDYQNEWRSRSTA